MSSVPSVRPPVVNIPPRIVPHEREDQELERLCFFPRPDPNLAPICRKAWNEIADANPEYVQVEIECQEGLYESRNWSGAILPTTRGQTYRGSAESSESIAATEVSSDEYREVFGTWIVPNAYPTKDLRTGKYIDGTYEYYTWVGIDGWKNKSAAKIGVQSVVVVKDHKIVGRYNRAAVLVMEQKDEANEIRIHYFNKFDVEFGDTLTGCLRIFWDHCGRAVRCYGTLYNRGSCQWTGAEIDVPPAITIKGISTEWILAGKTPFWGAEAGSIPPWAELPFPNYGSSVFYHGAAIENTGKEVLMSRALLLDAEDIPSISERGDQIIVKYPHLYYRK